MLLYIVDKALKCDMFVGYSAIQIIFSPVLIGVESLAVVLTANRKRDRVEANTVASRFVVTANVLVSTATGYVVRGKWDFPCISQSTQQVQQIR